MDSIYSMAELNQIVTLATIHMFVLMAVVSLTIACVQKLLFIKLNVFVLRKELNHVTFLF